MGLYSGVSFTQEINLKTRPTEAAIALLSGMKSGTEPTPLYVMDQVVDLIKNPGQLRSPRKHHPKFRSPSILQPVTGSRIFWKMAMLNEMAAGPVPFPILLRQNRREKRSYTEAEIDTKLAGKSDTSHTHSYRRAVLPHFYAFVNRQHCRFTFYFYRCRIEEVVSTEYCAQRIFILHYSFRPSEGRSKTCRNTKR